jgi:single-strand DNA-binding protein
MNSLKNKVLLIGNLGQDPEVKTFDSGKTKVNFKMATNDVYKNGDGEKITDTQWHNMVVWGKLAEVASKYLKKGSEVAVEGKLTSRQYKDKEGQTKYITEVSVNELLMLDKKPG